MQMGGMRGGPGGPMRPARQGDPVGQDSAAQRGRVRRTLRRLWGYLQQHVVFLVVASLLMVGGNVLSLVGPMLSGFAVDAIKTPSGVVDYASVIRYAWWMAALYVAASAMSYVLAVMMIRVSQRIVYTMRKDVFDRLLELPVAFFDKTQTGDIISHISYDIDTVNASLSTDLLQIATSVITVVGSLVLMLAIAPSLVLVFAVTIPISILFTRYRAKRVRPLFRQRSIKLGALGGYVEEVLSGQKTIRAYHQEATMLRRFDVHNDEAVEAYYKADYYGSVTGPSVNFINNLSLALISVFGSLLYLVGRITVGNLSSFVLYSRKFSGPINEAANIVSELQSAISAADRVFRLIDEPAEPADALGARDIMRAEGDMTMDDIHFAYVPETPIISGLSLDAPRGSLIAIVGPTGAGKTTLVNLLMRFYDPQSGTITMDGKDIATLTRQSLRKCYTMVLQDTWLFTGTVFENIAYGKEDATREEVIAAAKAAKIHSFIKALPDGYDTMLTENGTNISKGQKQMLTIARAMLLDSSVLILDEATSNVDTQTERRIQSAMRALMHGKTCFVIAHRLSTIREADQILVVEGGAIAEQGTHRELLAQRGQYAALYNAQFQ